MVTKTSKASITPPIIPGYVYRGWGIIKKVVLMTFLLSIVLVSSELVLWLKLFYLALSIPGFFFLFRFLPEPCKAVYIDKKIVRAEYDYGPTIEEELRNCYLVISVVEHHRSTGNHYYYELSLWAKRNYFPEKNLSDGDVSEGVPCGSFMEQGKRMFLAKKIYSPEDLKRYIDALQSQIDVSLELIFDTDQVKKDYLQGTYQAK